MAFRFSKFDKEAGSSSGDQNSDDDSNNVWSPDWEPEPRHSPVLVSKMEKFNLTTDPWKKSQWSPSPCSSGSRNGNKGQGHEFLVGSFPLSNQSARGGHFTPTEKATPLPTSQGLFDYRKRKFASSNYDSNQNMKPAQSANGSDDVDLSSSDAVSLTLDEIVTKKKYVLSPTDSSRGRSHLEGMPSRTSYRKEWNKDYNNNRSHNPNANGLKNFPGVSSEERQEQIKIHHPPVISSSPPTPTNGKKRPFIIDELKIHNSPIPASPTGPSPPILINGKKRPIIIDGSNLASGHILQEEYFSVDGIRVCMDFLTDRGYSDITVVFPETTYRWYTGPEKAYLDKLKNAGKLMLIQRKINDGALTSSYEAKVMLQMATKTGGVIVTNDRFEECQHVQWKEVSEKRLIQYRLIPSTKPIYIMFPIDPLGRNGCLDAMLHF